MSKPITPDEAAAKAGGSLPPEVFDAVNELLAEKYDGRKYATFTYREAAARIAKHLGIKVEEVYKKRYLDFEQAYRNAGWKVDQDQPGYNESYEGNWTFSKR